MPLSSLKTAPAILGIAASLLSPSPVLASARAVALSEAGFGELVLFQVGGLALVLTSLSALWGLCEVLARFFLTPPQKNRVHPVPPGAVQELAPGDIGADGIAAVEPHVAAIIAAAVSTVLGPDVQIVGMRPTLQPPSNPQLAAWTIQGRLQHHSSHRVR